MCALSLGHFFPTCPFSLALGEVWGKVITIKGRERLFSW